MKENNMSNFKSASFENSTMPEAIKETVRKGRPKSDNPKAAISIRLSPQVIEFFKASGKGWQTRIDETLLDYVSKQP